MRVTTAAALLLPAWASALPISVQYDPALGSRNLTGRVRLYLAPHNATPPSEQSSDGQETAQLFGVDVANWAPGAPLVVDGVTGDDADTP